METKVRRKIKFGNKEFSLSFIFSILSSLLGAVYSFLCAKFLQSEIYGELRYYISIVSFLNIFMLLGVDNFIIKKNQSSENKQNLQSKSFIFVIFISTLIFPIYFRIATTLLIRLKNNSTLILFLFIVALAIAFSGVFFAYLQSINKYQLRMFLSSLIPHILFLAIFTIHLITKSLNTFINFYLIYYFLIYGIVGIIMFFKYLFPLGGFFSLKECLSIIVIGLSYSLYNCNSAISNIIIGEKYESFGVVGIFSLSNQLLTIASLATGIVTQTSLTTFAKLAKQDNRELLYKNYERITRIGMYISIPFYAAFIIEAKQIMALFGESYTGNNFILILLSISSLLNCVTGPCGSILLMGGKEKENLIATIVNFVSFLLILALLINYTPLAAPIASIVSVVLSNLVKLLFVSKFQKRIFMSFKLLLTFICVTVISLLIFFGLSFIKNIVVWVIVNGIAGILLIIAFVVLSPFKEDKQYFIKGKEL